MRSKLRSAVLAVATVALPLTAVYFVAQHQNRAGYPDGHPCFYLGLYEDTARNVFVDDTMGHVAGPFHSVVEADSARNAVCEARMK